MNISVWKEKKDYCTGCGLCVNTCPTNAITMKHDTEGFLFPSVDTDRCTDCGQCLQDCAGMPGNGPSSKETNIAYACQAVDQELLVEATAGALFPVLAKWIIRKGGVVFGAAYDADMKVIHHSAFTMEQVAAFNGSKYVQSDCAAALSEAVVHLRAGKSVLFSGTPCQIAALLKLCTEEDKKELYTVDVVCYGVPSPGLFRAYLDTIESNDECKVQDFRFRDKHTNGWSHTTVIRKQYPDGTQKLTEQSDYSQIPYYKMFGCRDCFRRSCYRCKYNTLHRVSDITTGNFWGIENISAAFDANKGVSMALLNTPKGKTMFEAVKAELIVESRSIQDAILANDALVKGTAWPKRRDAIYRALAKKGFEKQYKKYYSDTVWRRLRSKISVVKQRLIGLVFRKRSS